MNATQPSTIQRRSTEFERCRVDPEVSIVVPALNEEACLHQMWQEVSRVCREVGSSFEVIFVDDGSTDSTWSIITELAEENPEVRGVRFSRNFGHQPALLAGLEHAEGGAVITMDADLQHPPDLIPEMVRRWRDGVDIVSTRRADTENGGIFKRLTARVFYSVFSSLSDMPIDRGKADFRLLDRRIVDLLLSMSEATLFLRGMVEWVGFSQEVIDYVPNERAGGGKSRYTLRKMVILALSGITSFSVAPLRLSLVVGVVTTMLSVAYALFAVYSALRGDVVRGWTSVVCFFSFLFGVQFIITGVLSEYLAQSIVELKRRPRYIVADSVKNVSTD